MFNCRKFSESISKQGHSFIPITIEHTNKTNGDKDYERVKQLLCQDCLRIFDIEDLSKRHYDEKNCAQQQKTADSFEQQPGT